MQLTKEEVTKLNNLFLDYHKLAKSHDKLCEDHKRLGDKLEQCCSMEKIIQRELAHTTLNKLVDKLEEITNKFLEMEKQQVLHNESKKKIEELDKKVTKLMLYSSTLFGAIAVVEYFGLLK